MEEEGRRGVEGELGLSFSLIPNITVGSKIINHDMSKLED